MCSQTPRKAAAILFLAAAVTLSCAAPSQASLLQPRYTSEEPARSEPGRGFVSFLLHLFDLIGGALDPNGSW
ncbi:MAG TPA: hypothetical protein VGM86_00260 [Thermoanaerobaculia bacterium]|jgi:hypothetical protein